VILIPKKAAEDTVLVAGNINGDTKALPIPAGSYININVPGLHYNRKCFAFSVAGLVLKLTMALAKYWKDPETFDPTRFLNKDWPRDAFLPFSLGARSCIGRK